MSLATASLAARSRATIMLTPGPAAKTPSCGPTISVVLPNYNHAKLIGRAAAALRAQKRPPDEIIIIDDASTDQSLRVIEEIAASWDIVRALTNKENQGTIAALLRGLAASEGKYIYFAAADDWVEPGFFSSAVDMMERHPQAGLFCGEADLMEAWGRAPPSGRPTSLDFSMQAPSPTCSRARTIGS
jgi:glycosyltransferase involved in cell wall biosynthesis